ncbi:MAG: YhcB family protein [Gammaproteobacteria bacterium]|nr:YhcB family protein [Gammaproteobacteria bacterium]
MYTLMELLLVGTVALLIGAFLGWALSKLLDREHRSERAAEKQLEQATANLKSYRREVSNHYVKTAQLVDELTESYRQLHNHLAHGSTTLLDIRGRPLMKTIPSREQIEAISQPATPLIVSPPLDYAPKTTPREKGMLDESFGLESARKQDQGSDDFSDIYPAAHMPPPNPKKHQR